MPSLHNSSFVCVLSTKHHLPIPPNGLGPVKSSAVFMEIISALTALKHVNKTIISSSVGRNNGGYSGVSNEPGKCLNKHNMV